MWLEIYKSLSRLTSSLTSAGAHVIRSNYLRTRGYEAEDISARVVSGPRFNTSASLSGLRLVHPNREMLVSEFFFTRFLAAITLLCGARLLRRGLILAGFYSRSDYSFESGLVRLIGLLIH